MLCSQNAENVIPFAYITHGFVAYLKSKTNGSSFNGSLSVDQNPEIDGALTLLSPPLNGHLKQL